MSLPSFGLGKNFFYSYTRNRKRFSTLQGVRTVSPLALPDKRYSGSPLSSGRPLRSLWKFPIGIGRRTSGSCGLRIDPTFPQGDSLPLPLRRVPNAHPRRPQAFESLGASGTLNSSRVSPRSFPDFAPLFLECFFQILFLNAHRGWSLKPFFVHILYIYWSRRASKNEIEKKEKDPYSS
jgi:hypothetical protein